MIAGIIFRRKADPDSSFDQARLVFSECNASAGSVTRISQYEAVGVSAIFVHLIVN
jgi:hypothetical protein